jgi:hypothetical protein
MLTAKTLAATVFGTDLGAVKQRFGMAAPLPYAVGAFGSAKTVAGPVETKTSINLLRQMSPNNTRARFLALLSSISFEMQPLSGLLVGYPDEHVGAATALDVNGMMP